MRRLLPILLLFASLLRAGEPAILVVTTSLLESAVRDYGPALPPGVEIVSLIPPGSCPGHFDLPPRMVPLLRQASLVVRHDFQQGLDGQMRKLGGEDLPVTAIAAKGSLLIPANYASMSSELADALVGVWPEQAEAIRARQQAVAREIAAVGENIQGTARPWQGAKVIVSQQQQAFCVWLGLDVTATLARPDDTSPRQLAELLRSDAVLVVGNLQSDAQAARSLAERKKVPVAVFSNFPASVEDGYAGLLAANLKELESAWQQHSQR
jgi:zinc transport system substrate-binding protein